VAARLLKGAAGGDVLLLHDGSAARDRRGAPVVLAALPRLLDELARRGLRAVPLPMPAGAAGAGGGGGDRDGGDRNGGEESS
jgi:peptidoglycan/xylan/chitin deacetylase (PgdA/CDA1 family)